MKAGLVLALWEVTTHVSLGGCLFILAGPTSGKHMQSVSRAELTGKENSVLLPDENANRPLQRILGQGMLVELAPRITNVLAERPDLADQRQHFLCRSPPST